MFFDVFRWIFDDFHLFCEDLGAVAAALSELRGVVILCCSVSQARCGGGYIQGAGDDEEVRKTMRKSMKIDENR